MSAQDLINHPPHYNQLSVECIDVIEGLSLGYHLGCCFKYLWRAGLKGGEEQRLMDLHKARWYLDRKIKLLEKETESEGQA